MNQRNSQKKFTKNKYQFLRLKEYLNQPRNSLLVVLPSLPYPRRLDKDTSLAGPSRIAPPAATARPPRLSSGLRRSTSTAA